MIYQDQFAYARWGSCVEKMASHSETHEIQLFIRRSPESVRAWWTDLPDDYQAKDPREEPFRIVTLRKFPNGRLLLTYWRRNDGSTYERHEVMVVRPDGSWTVEMTDGPRFHIHDTFTVTPSEGGTVLRIRQVRIPKDPAYTSLSPEFKAEFAEF